MYLYTQLDFLILLFLPALFSITTEKHNPKISIRFEKLMYPIRWWLGTLPIPEPKIDPNSSRSRYYHFSLTAFHDITFAACLILALARTIGIVFLIPIIIEALWKVFRKSDVIKEVESKKIKNKFNIEGNVSLRKSCSGSCHVFSIPFYNIIYLPNNVIENLEKKDSIAKINHEVGHCGNFDWLIVKILSYGSVALFLVVFLLLYNIANGSVAVERTDYFWIIGLVAVLIYAVWSLAGILYRREYMADHFALQKEPRLFSEWLKKRKLGDSSNFYPNKFVKTYNSIVHPSWSDRFEAQSRIIKRHEFVSTRYAFLWSFFTLLAMCSIFMDAHVNQFADKYFMKVIGPFYIPFIPMVMFIYCMGISIYKTVELHGSPRYVGNDIYIFRGYFLGAISFALFLSVKDGQFNPFFLDSYLYILCAVIAVVSFIIPLEMICKWHQHLNIENRAPGIVIIILGVCSLIAGVFLPAEAMQDIEYDGEYPLLNMSGGDWVVVVAMFLLPSMAFIFVGLPVSIILSLFVKSLNHTKNRFIR